MAWFVLGVLVLAFYGFIGFAPTELAQLLLAILWALMILATIASTVSALFL